MHAAVRGGCHGVREEMNGDHFRSRREHHFPFVSPVFLARSALSRNHYRISNRKNLRPYPVLCVLKCDIQHKRFYMKTGGFILMCLCQPV